jgi:hypothetical protein
MLKANTWFRKVGLCFFSMLLVCTVFPRSLSAHPEGMAFPIIGAANYTDSFFAGRANGIHHAIDIFAPKHAAIVSATNGVITYVGYPQDSWGYQITIRDDDGFRYIYLHINNDRPGTDDGQGGPMHAYAPDIKEGSRVYRGQHIGYVGDSGNAETTSPHLHLEIVKPEYSGYDVPLEGFVNPFTYLNSAQRLGVPATYPPLAGELLPYGNKVRAGVSLARGNLDVDPESEMVVGAGSNGGPHVRVYDNDYSYFEKEFMAYDPYFSGGIDVAVGNVDGAPGNEIITAAGKGGGPHIKIFDVNGVLKSQFYAYDYRFAGGVRVATGDTDGDGEDEIITGILGQGGPHVKVLRSNGTIVREFMAYDPYFVGGVDITAGDTDGDGEDEIITSPGPGGGPHVKVFGGNAVLKSQFYAYDHRFAGGIRVSSDNVLDGQPNDEIIVIPWSSGGPQLKVFRANGSLQHQRYTLEVWWEGFYDIAASDGEVVFGTGHNRRSSIRAYSY